MKPEPTLPPDSAAPSATSLREQAEAALRARQPQSDVPRDASPETLHIILHELQVHQIELEMQNDELRRSQVALEAARSEYFELYELAPVGYCTVDAAGRIQRANLTLANLLGVTRGALLHQPLPRYLPGGDADTYHVQTQAALARQSQESCQVRLNRAEGPPAWVHLVIHPVLDHDGQPVCHLALTDITEMKQAQRKVQESEHAYHVLTDSVREAIVTTGPDGRIRDWNESAVRLFGYAPAETIGQPLRLILPHRPEAVASTCPRPEPETVHPFAPRSAEEWGRRKDGTEFPLESSQTQWSVDGQWFVTTIIRDITARRRREAEDAIREARLKEAGRLEGLEVMAGGIAHDLNNILGAVLNATELITDILPPNGPAGQYLGIIRDSTQRAADLGRQLLDYAGGGRINFRNLDLNRIVGNALQPLRAELVPPLEVRLELAPDLPPVQGDGQRLQQVLTSIVKNAQEAIGPGPGTITIRTGWQAAPEEAAAAAPAESRVYVEVTDTGCGMTAETMARIFDPFFTTKFIGRGLGLSSARGIVHAHHGTIEVRSSPGAGSTFRIRLPRSPAALAESAPPFRIPAAPASGPACILVVDDDAAMRETTADLLRLHGFEVVVAEDGRAGVDRVQAEPDRFQIVLMDLQMPRLDGDRAFEEMRRIRADLPVVLISGYAPSEVSARFKGSQPAAFFQKPFDLGSLLATLEGILAASPSGSAGSSG